jgi:hypothetical protein
MENTTDFVLPVIEKTRKPKKQPPKQILEERPRLPRTNRTIKCAFCASEKILNPDQYQALFDYWGNEEKIEREFMCKDCDVAMKDNPILFWAKYSELLPALARKIRAAFEVFNSSTKGNENTVVLQNMVNSFLGEVKIDTRLAEYGTEPAPNGFTVKNLKLNNMPFIGTVTLYPYEQPSNRIRFNQ